MPFTIIFAIPEPSCIIDEIELEHLQAYYLEPADDYNGWFAGYKPAVVRKLGIENVNIYTLGCHEDNDYCSSFNLIETTENGEDWLIIPNESFNNFVNICEKLIISSKRLKMFMILDCGVYIIDENGKSNNPVTPSERYIDYDYRFIEYSDFLYDVQINLRKFEIESIWEIYQCK